MFSPDFIFRQQEILVDNQKCQAGFRPLCNKILVRAPALLMRERLPTLPHIYLILEGEVNRNLYGVLHRKHRTRFLCHYFTFSNET